MSTVLAFEEFDTGDSQPEQVDLNWNSQAPETNDIDNSDRSEGEEDILEDNTEAYDMNGNTL